MRPANSVRSSDTSSGTVSSTSYCQRTLRRFVSFRGIGALMQLVRDDNQRVFPEQAESINFNYEAPA